MRKQRTNGLGSTAVAVALAATALFAIAALPAGAAAPKKPNIVVIMSDDQRQDDAAIMAKLKSRIAAQGTEFANSYVSYSLCCPSRTSFLTGQYMHNHGITWNFWPEGGYFKFKHSTNDGGWGNTVPKWLQNAGYHTGLIGKYLNEYGTNDPTTPADDSATERKLVPPGWNEWVGGIDPTTYSAYGYWLNINGKPKLFGHCSRVNPDGSPSTNPYAGCLSTSQIPDDGKSAAQLKAEGITSPNKDGSTYQTDVLSTYAENFIKTNAKKTKPFFLWVTPNAPHTATATGLGEGLPAIPPYRYKDRNFDSQWLTDVFNKPSFNEDDVCDKPDLSSTISAEPGCGVRWFPKLGQDSIAVLKKHFVQRRQAVLGVDDMVGRVYDAVKKSGKLSNTIFIFTSDNGWLMGEHRVPANKLFGFDESIRVPLYISGPGFTKTGGRKVQETAINVDLAPTILKAAGATPGRAMDGVPLQNVIASPSAWKDRSVAIEVGQNPRAANYSGLHNDYWHLEKIEGGGLPVRYELYDLRKDPFEINAVTNDPKYASVLETLKAQLETLAACKGRACDMVGNAPASP